MGYDGLVNTFGTFNTQRQAAAEWRAVVRDLPQSFTANGFPGAESGDRRAAALQIQRLFDVVSALYDRSDVAAESSPASAMAPPSGGMGASSAGSASGGSASSGGGVTRYQFGSFMFMCDLLTTRRIRPVGAQRSHPVSARPLTHQGMADRYENLKLPLFMAAGGHGAGGGPSSAPSFMSGVGLSMLSPPSMRRLSHQTSHSGAGPVDTTVMVQFHHDVVFDAADVDAVFSYCSHGGRGRLNIDAFVVALSQHARALRTR